jgi:hypothetical protein
LRSGSVNDEKLKKERENQQMDREFGNLYLRVRYAQLETRRVSSFTWFSHSNRQLVPVQQTQDLARARTHYQLLGIYSDARHTADYRKLLQIHFGMFLS